MIETRERGVFGTLKVIALWSLVSTWAVATLSMVTVNLLTSFHVGLSIVVESLLFHESSKSVDSVSCVFDCVSQCFKVELPLRQHEAMKSILKGCIVLKEIVAA